MFNCLKKKKIRFVFFPSDSILSFFSLLPTAHSDVLPTPAYQWLRLGSIRALIISELFKSCGQCQHSTLALPLLASLSVSSGQTWHWLQVPDRWGSIQLDASSKNWKQFQLLGGDEDMHYTRWNIGCEQLMQFFYIRSQSVLLDHS